MPLIDGRREHRGAHEADVAARLRPVCAGLPPAEFDPLVGDIARMKLRWAAAD